MNKKDNAIQVQKNTIIKIKTKDNFELTESLFIGAFVLVGLVVLRLLPSTVDCALDIDGKQTASINAFIVAIYISAALTILYMISKIRQAKRNKDFIFDVELINKDISNKRGVAIVSNGYESAIDKKSYEVIDISEYGTIKNNGYKDCNVVLIYKEELKRGLVVETKIALKGTKIEYYTLGISEETDSKVIEMYEDRYNECLESKAYMYGVCNYKD